MPRLPSKPYPPPPYSTSISPLASFHTPPIYAYPISSLPPNPSPLKTLARHSPTHQPSTLQPPPPHIYLFPLSSSPQHTTQHNTTHIFALMNRYGLGRAIPRSGFARASRIENRPPSRYCRTPSEPVGHLPSLSEAFRLCHW